MNNPTTSNDTNSSSSAIEIGSRSCRNAFVQLTLYLDLFSGDKSLARYFAVCYVAVPIFETIGLSGSLSIPSPVFNLCTLAVP